MPDRSGQFIAGLLYWAISSQLSWMAAKRSKRGYDKAFIDHIKQQYAQVQEVQKQPLQDVPSIQLRRVAHVLSSGIPDKWTSFGSNSAQD